MAPTVFREEGFRFFFFSREEVRMHVHVYSHDGEAKFWLEPSIKLAKSYGFSERQVNKIGKLVKEHENELRSAWNRHFRN